MPLWEYAWAHRSPWLLGMVAVCAGQCVALGVALRLARRGSYQQSITLVCIGNWASVSLLTFIAPAIMPVMVLVALVPVVFAEHYIRWQRGLASSLIAAGCVLALGVLGRFQSVSHLAGQVPRWIETAFIIAALPINALHILVIVWNNAAALRTSQAQLAERAAQLAASRTRLITAADEERRRVERDLHDGAQQHLVSLAVLLQLARSADDDRYQPLLIEASGLVETRSPRSADSPTVFTPRCSSAAVWVKPYPQSPRAPRSPCAWTCRPSAATPLPSRPPCTSAAAKRCRMPLNTAAPAPRSRSRPVPTTERLPSRSATTAADSIPRPWAMG
jgi:Histidine kinase